MDKEKRQGGRTLPLRSNAFRGRVLQARASIGAFPSMDFEFLAFSVDIIIYLNARSFSFS